MSTTHDNWCCACASQVKNGKFLTEIMPSEEDVTEIKWKENTIKVNPHEVQQLETVKGKFLDNILLNLQERFPIESTNVVNAFAIPSLCIVRFQPRDLSTYGNEELETLLSYNGSAKEMQSGEVVLANADAEKCRIEWNFAKELVVREHYPVGHIAELWILMATHQRDKVQNLIKLSQLALVLPTNAAGCERGFSAQNRIKNALRNRLKADRLDLLMTIDIEGPPSVDFDFSLALDKWAKKNRKIFKS